MCQSSAFHLTSETGITTLPLAGLALIDEVRERWLGTGFQHFSLFAWAPRLTFLRLTILREVHE